MSSDGEILAQTNVSDDGTEERSYPYSNIFAHVVGYDTNGKSGLESEANFQLLSSHEFFLTQIKNEFMGAKNVGDTVVSTLNADLQTTAYNSLGDRRGAVSSFTSCSQFAAIVFGSKSCLLTIARIFPVDG